MIVPHLAAEAVIDPDAITPGGRGNGQDTDFPPVLPELAEFLATDFPEPVQLIGPIYNENIVHAAAAAGMGKTQLGVALAWQLVHGAALWHWDCPERRSVGFVDGEMPGRGLQDRFNMYPWREGRETLRVMNAVSWAGGLGLPHPNLSEQAWQDAFAGWAAELEVLIFDNVMSLVSVPGTSMASDEFWKPVYDFNLRMRAAGKTVIWLDHVNASGNVFGTKTKLWPADLAITLSHEGGNVGYSEGGVGHPKMAGCEFVMSFPKTRGQHGDDVAECELKLLMGRDGFATWTHAFTDEQKHLTACLLKENGMSIRQIAAEMGVPKSSVARWISQGEK